MELAPEVRDVGAKQRRRIGVLGAPDLGQQLAVGHQQAAVERERAQQRELERRQVDVLAVEGHAVGGEVDDQPVGLDPRLRRVAPGAPQHRLHAGHELTRRERLRDVVVGSALQRRDLGLLVGDRGEHDDRQLAPAAQLAADLDPGAVREHQVDDRGMRAGDRRAVERLLGARARDDLVAGTAQHEPQRPQDLGVVVADEDPLARHQAAAPCAASAGPNANSTMKLVP